MNYMGNMPLMRSHPFIIIPNHIWYQITILEGPSLQKENLTFIKVKAIYIDFKCRNLSKKNVRAISHMKSI